MSDNEYFQMLQEQDRQAIAAREAKSYISSGFTVELLKQAMDDAKKVREIAFANAKAALEEAFNNHGNI